MKKLALVLLLVAVSSLPTGCASWPMSLTPARVWCTGICESYEAEIEFAYRDASPDADRVAMDKIRREMVGAMKRGDWDSAQNYVSELRCAALIGLSEYRAQVCR